MVLESNGTVSLCITPDYESHTLIVREFAVSDLRYMASEPTREAVKFRVEDAPRPPYKLLHFARKFVQT